MLPILNHSLFININNKTTKVIVEIVISVDFVDEDDRGFVLSCHGEEQLDEPRERS